MKPGKEAEFLDITPEAADWNKYQASAGHKINHNSKNNGAYTECVHPIFGKILCFYSLKVCKSDFLNGNEIEMKEKKSIQSSIVNGI